jgi:hypothetical protein
MNRFNAYLLYLLTIISPMVLCAAPWKVVRVDDDITVSERKEADRELPSFKGEGLVKSRPFPILAVLADGTRRREWMHRSGETKVLKQVSDYEAISYQQTLAPWPVSDREVIMRTRVFIIQKENDPYIEIIATFDGEKHDDLKKLDGDKFVWMSYLKGYWHLKQVGPEETMVTYMVNTDPGGSLPNWLINRITRDLPYYTIFYLREQVGKTKGQYESYLKKYDLQYPNRTTPAILPPAITEQVKKQVGK